MRERCLQLADDICPLVFLNIFIGFGWSEYACRIPSVDADDEIPSAVADFVPQADGDYFVRVRAIARR